VIDYFNLSHENADGQLGESVKSVINGEIFKEKKHFHHLKLHKPNTDIIWADIIWADVLATTLDHRPTSRSLQIKSLHIYHDH
jgi:hypothetical protein